MASEAGTPSTGTLTRDRSITKLAARTPNKGNILTQSENACKTKSYDQEQKSNPELASLANDGEEWTASSSLPDLMQRRIHVLDCKNNVQFDRNRQDLLVSAKHSLMRWLNSEREFVAMASMSMSWSFTSLRCGIVAR